MRRSCPAFLGRRSEGDGAPGAWASLGGQVDEAGTWPVFQRVRGGGRGFRGLRGKESWDRLGYPSGRHAFDPLRVSGLRRKFGEDVLASMRRERHAASLIGVGESEEKDA